MTQPSRAGRHAAPDDAALSTAPPAPPLPPALPPAPALAQMLWEQPPAQPPAQLPWEQPPAARAPWEQPPPPDLGPLPGDFVPYRPTFSAPKRSGARIAVFVTLLAVIVAAGAGVWWFKYRHTVEEHLACSEVSAGIDSNAGVSATIKPGVPEPTGVPLPTQTPDVTCGGTMVLQATGKKAAVTMMGWHHLHESEYEADLLAAGWARYSVASSAASVCDAYRDVDRLQIMIVCLHASPQVVGYVSATGA